MQVEVINALALYKSTSCEEWDVCIDGIWYSIDYDGTDISDRAMLQNTITDNNLEIKNIPMWNSKNVESLNYKKYVVIDANNAYLVITD